MRHKAIFILQQINQCNWCRN